MFWSLRDFLRLCKILVFWRFLKFLAWNETEGVRHLGIQVFLCDLAKVLKSFRGRFLVKHSGVFGFSKNVFDFKDFCEVDGLEGVILDLSWFWRYFVLIIDLGSGLIFLALESR